MLTARVVRVMCGCCTWPFVRPRRRLVAWSASRVAGRTMTEGGGHGLDGSRDPAGYAGARCHPPPAAGPGTAGAGTGRRPGGRGRARHMARALARATAPLAAPLVGAG